MGKTIRTALAGAILGGLTGLIGGVFGGWVSGYYDPLVSIPGIPTELKFQHAMLGAEGGTTIGAIAGLLVGALVALVGGIASPIKTVAAAGIIFWFLAGLTPESVVGFPGAPVVGAIFGVLGGYAGRWMVRKYFKSP